MNRSGSCIAAIAFLVLAPLARAEPSGALILVTDGEFPPFSILKSYGVAGLSTEILTKVMERTGIRYRLGVYPWLRGYDMALKERNTCLYPAFRTPEREASFKWIGPIAHDQLAIFALADSALSPTSLNDLKTYRIGGVQGTAIARFLETQGLTLDEANAENGNEVNLKKLQSGRLDFWAETLFHGNYIATKYGASIKPVLKLKDYDGYLACNPSVEDSTIETVNASLARMAADGSIARLSKPYHLSGQ